MLLGVKKILEDVMGGFDSMSQFTVENERAQKERECVRQRERRQEDRERERDEEKER